MTKHIHAELMAQYAQDALETDRPWERWEQRDIGEEDYRPLNCSPSWGLFVEYRRKPETRHEPEYVYSHKLTFDHFDGSFSDEHSIANATHISVYRRKAGEVTDRWVYDIPIPQELSKLMGKLPEVVKLFDALNSLEKNGFQGTSED